MSNDCLIFVLYALPIAILTLDFSILVALVLMILQDYIHAAFNRFPDFLVQAFKIDVDS